jgi:hypothetical protein
MFRVVLPPIIKSAYNCIYSIWYLSDAVDTVVCAPDDGWRYRSKRVEQFPDMNKLCKVASCFDIYWSIFTRYGTMNVKYVTVRRMNDNESLEKDDQG